MRRFIFFVLIICGVVYGVMLLSENKRPLSSVKSGVIMQITSPAFPNNGTIPTIYTCSGENINPPLSFSGIANDARSLALIMDDPDAPNGTFTHWVVFNMPATTTELPQNTKPPGIEAKNGANLEAYTGPCPPSGEHRYYFRLYALDSMLDESSVTNRTNLEETMKGHILDSAEYYGRFTKSK